jgi:short-subunit dehydrogenase
VVTDLADPEQVSALVRTVIERAGRVDVWIGAASLFAFGSVTQTPAAVYERIVATNLLGQIHSVREVLPHLREQGTGTIVLVGSLFSRAAAPYASAYVASKFGILGFASSLRQELVGSHGIRAKMVLPASVDTRIYQRAANYTGQDVHPIPPIVAPARVARAMEKAARGRGRDVVVVGRMQAALAMLDRLSPRAYDRVIRTSMKVFALRGRNVPTSDGAVLTPESDPGTETGGWRSTPVRVLVAATTGKARAPDVRVVRNSGAICLAGVPGLEPRTTESRLARPGKAPNRWSSP